LQLSFGHCCFCSGAIVLLLRVRALHLLQLQLLAVSLRFGLCRRRSEGALCRLVRSHGLIE
jgi:hypothetical protein